MLTNLPVFPSRMSTLRCLPGEVVAENLFGVPVNWVMLQRSLLGTRRLEAVVPTD